MSSNPNPIADRNMEPNPGPILFFDGVCGLCNGVVRWVYRHDPSGKVRFAQIQAGSARMILKSQGVSDSELDALETVYVLSEGRLYRRSAAVLKILSVLPSPWSAGVVLRVIPPGILDLFYRFVSRIRYSIFGRSEHCKIPDEGIRSRFIPL
jgi:predicted DCC family thiol-disulfide oxidoreductase YuxK